MHNIEVADSSTTANYVSLIIAIVEGKLINKIYYKCDNIYNTDLKAKQ